MNTGSYESWRVSYQSSEQAARSAFTQLHSLYSDTDMLKRECARLNAEIERLQRLDISKSGDANGL